MMRLNVRCCCQPQKIVGTLEVHSLARLQNIYIAQPLSIMENPTPVMAVTSATIELRDFCDGSKMTSELAVYSDDRPIEFWRQLKGFEEAPHS
jgi:hypothetical protein